jgi:hypothetical protein
MLNERLAGFDFHLAPASARPFVAVPYVAIHVNGLLLQKLCGVTDGNLVLARLQGKEQIGHCSVLNQCRFLVADGRSLGSVLQGGAGWCLPPFHQSASGWRITPLARSFSSQLTKGIVMRGREVHPQVCDRKTDHDVDEPPRRYYPVHRAPSGGVAGFHSTFP